MWAWIYYWYLHLDFLIILLICFKSVIKFSRCSAIVSFLFARTLSYLKWFDLSLLVSLISLTCFTAFKYRYPFTYFQLVAEQTSIQSATNFLKIPEIPNRMSSLKARIPEMLKRKRSSKETISKSASSRKNWNRKTVSIPLHFFPWSRTSFLKLLFKCGRQIAKWGKWPALRQIAKWDKWPSLIN